MKYLCQSRGINMKVLHILQSNRFSGAENVVCQIIALFQNDSDYQMVYTSEDGQIGEELKKRQIEFVPMVKLCKQELRRVISEINPDIIHAHDRKASFLASKVVKNTPIIVHMHVNNNKGLLLFLKNLIWVIRSKKYAHIFWVSNSAFDCFQFNRFVKNKSSILYNVLDKNAIIQKSELDENDYYFDVVYCGRMTYQKNPERLMQICNDLVKENNSIKIGLIGDGDYSDYVKDYIQLNRLTENVKYFGFVSNPLKIIKCSKVMIMVSRFEGTPMVAIEAQILGVPIVSTPADGMKDIIKNDVNGYLTDNNEEFVKCVFSIINCYENRMKMSENSKDCILKFCDIDSFKKTLNLKYYDVVKYSR